MANHLVPPLNFLDANMEVHCVSDEHRVATSWSQSRPLSSGS